MPDKTSDTPDVNTEAAHAVRELTGSEPIDGADGLDSPELKRLFREAKERERQRSASSDESVKIKK